MRYGLVIGAACLVLLGGAVSCSAPGAGQVQAVPQANDDCTHYVDNQASTDGDGSLDTPWNNIAGHIGDLEAGDVLCVRGDPSAPDRVYTETVISPDNNIGTPSRTPVRADLQASDGCTHYVDNRAPTDGDGSLAAPWDSVARHVGDLGPGDVMCLRGNPGRPGQVYSENVVVSAGTGCVSGTPADPITITTYDGEYVILRSASAGSRILDVDGLDYWVVDGTDEDLRIEFDKQGGWPRCISLRNGADHNVIRYCEVYDCDGYGIVIDGSDYNTVEYCEIYDMDKGPYDDAIGVWLRAGSNNVVQGNEIYDCRGDCVHFGKGGPAAGNVVQGNELYVHAEIAACCENAVDVKRGSPAIRQNVIHGFRLCDGSCGGSGSAGAAIVIHQEAGDVLVEGNEIYDSGCGIRILDGGSVRVVNNVIRDIVTDPDAWTNCGIQIHGGVSVSIVNNTLVDVPRVALVIGMGRDLDIRNNLFYDTGQIALYDAGTEAAADYNGWFSAAERLEGAHDAVGDDPLFVSPGDYHLRAISPAVDAGDNAGAPAHDLDGSPRPYGPAVDLGAFEVQEPLPVTTLRVSEGMTTTNSVTVTLIWIEPGQVGQSSTAHHSELRYDTQVITQEGWDQATVAEANISARQPGDVQRTIVSLPWSGSGHLYFALRVFDVDNIGSEVSNPAFWPFESMFLPFVAATAVFSRTIKWGLTRAQAQTSVVQNSPCEDFK